MTDALVEKVARAIGMACDEEYEDDEWKFFVPEARAAILAVLDHFSEPSNVTDGMAKASLHALIDFVESEEDNERDKIAQAMRAARDEVSRG